MAAPQITPAWFTPAFWQARDAVIGQAPGRGASLFISASAVVPSDAQWVLRTYLRGGFAARISETRYVWTGLERTRAFREMRLNAALHERGLPVPTPVAGCVWRHSLTYQAGLLTERLMGARSLADVLPEADEALLARVGETVRRFHEAGLDHVDLNARNLLVTPDERVWLIDLDRCRLRAPGNWQEANLKRLQRSVERFVPGQGKARLRQIRQGYDVQ
ncbi:3-deoxy-D-manno-octulosonic acid kinase [Modicisalibacter xianhensis]|uniref:3-deoxy-D-manno-octulosonic acid kinase n=2 Tax=Modicisalibacter xianhensis TaxID=442341 RepID=A0A4R8FX05_9GAMM|nr:3-deoxy-D-manno-octulosonic acid kinase [Halomonas xianhensis]